MADTPLRNLVVRAEKDLEHGLLTLFAEVEGKLVPIATEKLGAFEQREKLVDDTPPATPPATG
jgi:hypothetical protein